MLIDIINTLECSADELLCGEVEKAWPIRANWLMELVEDCSSTEVKLITDLVISMKESLQRHCVEEKQST